MARNSVSLVVVTLASAFMAVASAGPCHPPYTYMTNDYLTGQGACVNYSGFHHCRASCPETPDVPDLECRRGFFFPTTKDDDSSDPPIVEVCVKPKPGSHPSKPPKHPRKRSTEELETRETRKLQARKALAVPAAAPALEEVVGEAGLPPCSSYGLPKGCPAGEICVGKYHKRHCESTCKAVTCPAQHVCKHDYLSKKPVCMFTLVFGQDCGYTCPTGTAANGKQLHCNVTDELYRNKNVCIEM